MPRYFFHARDQQGEVRDEEGCELPDLAAARARATLGARSLICDQVMNGQFGLDGSVVVADAAGNTLWEVSYREAAGLLP